MVTKKTKYIAKQPDVNGHIPYTAKENETWSILYQRQRPIVEKHACQEYLHGLDLLALSPNHIPQCKGSF